MKKPEPDRQPQPKPSRFRFTRTDIARQLELAELLAAEAGFEQMSRTAAIRVAVVRAIRAMKEKQT